MKKTLRGKLFKVVTLLTVAAACGATCVSLSGCAKTKSVSGEMHYVQWGTDYGIKVNVEVQSDKKGDRIKKVTVADSDYVEASDARGDWDPKVWYDSRQTLLNAYRGQYVSDILALEVITNGEVPLVKEDEEFVNYGDNLIITGATLGSGRLLVAVQNALKTFDGYKVVEGEYGYNSWGTNYGAKVRVVLKDNVVKKVVRLSSGYCNATTGMPSWNPQLWNEKEDSILAAYAGKTVDQVLDMTATVEGQNGATENSVSDSSLLATGATMSSARLLLAVQNALANA